MEPELEEQTEADQISSEWNSVARSGQPAANQLHVLPLPIHAQTDTQTIRSLGEDGLGSAEMAAASRSGSGEEPGGWNAGNEEYKVTSAGSLSGSDLGCDSSYSGREENQRNSSPDSGCDMSVMVAYTSEPKVRRPEPGITTIDVATAVPVVSARQAGEDKNDGRVGPFLRNVATQSHHTSIFVPSSFNKAVAVPKEAAISSPRHCSSAVQTCSSPLAPSTQVKDDISEIHHILPPANNNQTKMTLNASSKSSRFYPLHCPYSRAGIYSLEGKHLQDQLEENSSDSGISGSVQSGLRPYASTRDILELYGQSSGQPRPLTPRLLGFSSSDLRLPPAALLLSLSGKKAQSAFGIDCGLPTYHLNGVAHQESKGLYHSQQGRHCRDMYF